MIQINLLPEAYRLKARTPFKVMLSVTGSVSLVGCLVAYWAWLALGIGAEVESQRSVAQMEMDGLTPQVNYFNSLDAETKVYASREKTLAEITSNRILWTKKVDELIDVVNIGDDGLRHYIWFDDLNVSQSADRRSKTFGELRANGHSGSAQWDQVAVFLEDVADPEVSDFIRDFNSPAWPEGTQSSKDDELVPSEVWAFPLKVELKSPEDRGKSSTKAAEVKQ
jgi:hypothetical protein